MTSTSTKLTARRYQRRRMSRIAKGLLGPAVQKTAFAKIAKGGGLGSSGYIRPLSKHLVVAVPVAGYEPPPLVAQRFLPSHPLLPPTCDARQEDIGLNDVRERRTEFGIIFPFSSRQLGACSIEDFPVLAI